MKHGFIKLNHIELDVVVAGDGPVLLLLHGFPEFWYSWRHQIKSLSRQFTVVVPDLRGYGQSAKPAAVEAYDQDVLVSDLLALKQYYSPGSDIFIMGHDWGAALGYLFCTKYPKLVSRFVALSFPHPKDFKYLLRSNGSQMWRSWYIFFFQIPLLPELFLSIGNFFLLRRIVYKGWSGSPDAVSSRVWDRYIAHIRTHRFLRTAIHYYRAIFRHTSDGSQFPPVAVPTLALFGEKDRLASSALLRLTENSHHYYSASFEFRMIPGAGHWLQQEKPEMISNLAKDFFCRPTA